jgi:23S rRNA (adenine2503-C2)-methyltransferase
MNRRQDGGSSGKKAPVPAASRPGVSSRPSPQARQAPLALYRPDIYDVLVAAAAPSYRHDQVYEHLLRRPLRPFSQATVLPADTRRVLDDLGPSSLTPVASQTASDGTTKVLLSGRDGSCVEMVIMPYRKRITVCISSQVGCPVGCAFCATGAMGFRRNLSAAEIVDQVGSAAARVDAEGGRVSNVVYMGMGEPLLNLQAVLDSIRILTDPRGMDLAHRAISVSTVGIPSGIVRLARSEPQINLALSLHAADDHTRAALIPKSFLHPLTEILAAAWEHFSITRRKLLVEYVLLRGINDSVDDAKKLATLLRGHVVTVNLLRWNSLPRRTPGDASGPVSARSRTTLPSAFQPSPPATIAAFRETLLGAHVETVVRQSKGADILAACGQLAGRRQTYDGSRW